MCGVFSRVYFHNTDRMHTHTLSQNGVFMKVANALIHGGE